MDVYQGSVYDPVSLHKYLYANANPVMYIDPSGYSTLSLDIGAAQVLVAGIQNVCAKAAMSALGILATIQNSILYVTSITGFSSLVVALIQNPAFIDLTYNIANGTITSADIIQTYIETITNLPSNINDLVTKIEEAHSASGDYSGSSGSSSGSAMPPNDPNWLQQLAEKIKFGSDSKSPQKIANQMQKRGWTEDSVRSTITNNVHTSPTKNMATGNPATAYFNSDHSYVVIDDITYEVVQVSNRLVPVWAPDKNIVSPY
jgi:hypothetical protein